MIDGWGISCEIALRWMSLDFTDDQSTLVQVMAWCRQATSHYLSQCWPRSLLPYGVSRPQWLNSLFPRDVAGSDTGLILGLRTANERRCPSKSVVWNNLFVPKLQWLHHWSLGMDKLFHPTPYWVYDYLSMPRLKLINVSMWGKKLIPMFSLWLHSLYGLHGPQCPMSQKGH